MFFEFYFSGKEATKEQSYCRIYIIQNDDFSIMMFVSLFIVVDFEMFLTNGL